MVLQLMSHGIQNIEKEQKHDSSKHATNASVTQIVKTSILSGSHTLID